jgi:hypothetical protein
VSLQSFIARVTLRHKIRVLSTVQTLFLLILTGLGWMALHQSNDGARRMAERTPKLKVLNDTPETDLQDGIAGLTAFSARVTDASGDSLTVVAQEPAA